MSYPGSKGCRSHTGNTNSGYNQVVGGYSCLSHTGVDCATHVNTSGQTIGQGTDYCATNAAPWSTGVEVGDSVDAVDQNELRAKVISELIRRSKDQSMVDSVEATPEATIGSDIKSETIKALREAIVNMTSWIYPSSLNDASIATGKVIQSTQFGEMRDELNTAAVECLCNCNYCTCNCNYCTCNCNYSCTCTCNYSDKRLKKDIRYI